MLCARSTVRFSSSLLWQCRQQLRTNEQTLERTWPWFLLQRSSDWDSALLPNCTSDKRICNNKSRHQLCTKCFQRLCLDAQWTDVSHFCPLISTRLAKGPIDSAAIITHQSFFLPTKAISPTLLTGTYTTTALTAQSHSWLTILLASRLILCICMATISSSCIKDPELGMEL